jgi:hypothetical protein
VRHRLQQHFSADDRRSRSRSPLNIHRRGSAVFIREPPRCNAVEQGKCPRCNAVAMPSPS